MPGFLRIGVALGLWTLIGAVGFSWIEGWSFADSLYMAIITITTVGYEEVHPLSPEGRGFVIVYIMVGVGAFMYGLSELGQMVVHNQMRDWIGRRKMDSEVKSTRDHYVICGYGRLGRNLGAQLRQRGLPLVVIEREPEIAARCRDDGHLCVLGDAAEEAVLLEAGLERARGLAAVLAGDADNLYVVLSARLLAPRLRISSRAIDERAVPKLKRAGADDVVSVYASSARHMALRMHNPELDEFVSIFTEQCRDVELVQVTTTPHSDWAGRNLEQARLSARGVIVVGIRTRSGELLMPPPSTRTIEPGDALIAVGRGPALTVAFAPEDDVDG